ncbi:N-acyl homoserine lactonase family protein [Streptomyces sp. NPDC060209]|uniref:N-acyl homoserine lactonase family protein n=1 Tax=Streptomyces sp. NPDC060209 TaxID=3347073 RepID=UPI0036576877
MSVTAVYPQVHAFVCGRLTVPRGFLIAGGEGDINVPVPAYLITHQGRHMLFDTGLSHRANTDLSSYMDEKALAKRRFHFSPAEELSNQLAGAGVAPESISLIANSHLHYDHCGGNAQFPQAEVLVQRHEWEAANAAPADSGSYRKADFDVGQKVTLLDGAHDVFGDGTVQLVPTTGHTPGHQSLLVATEHGRAVLTADACYLRETLEQRRLPGIVADPDAVMATLDWFAALQEDGVQVIFGHDPDFWSERSLAPVELLAS